MRIAVIVPFLNEERYLPATLEGLAGQRRPPDRLLLVDDGSTDGSPAQAERFAAEHPWARALRRPPRPAERDRLATAAELRAFQWALGELEDGHDVIAKLDADIVLSEAVLEEVERRFGADPQLGLTGPVICAPGPDGTPQRHHSPPEHVEGGVSFYRAACLEQISPVPPILGWDIIDEMRARMRGWRTESFESSSGDPLHLRPMGVHDGLLRGYRRWGAGSYAYGEHPLHAVLLGAKQARHRPYVLGGASYVAGWALAAARRAPRAEAELRDYVRRDQLRRIRRRLTRLRPAGGGARD